MSFQSLRLLIETQKIEQMKDQETHVVAALKKSRTIKISNHKEISITESSFTDKIGIGTWAKIDFLINHCGYSVRKEAA
jgi:hypothetical protein